MRTLYLRNVPDDVVDRLETLASAEGVSVSAMAIRELSHATMRAHNRRLLDSLPDLGFPTGTIVEILDTERADR